MNPTKNGDKKKDTEWQEGGGKVGTKRDVCSTTQCGCTYYPLALKHHSTKRCQEQFGIYPKILL